MKDYLWGLTTVLILVVGGFLLGIPLWNTMGIETRRCEVVSAGPMTSSGGSRGSASTAGVLIGTSSCGSLELSQGVTRDTRDEIAASFVIGAEYDIETGWFSRVVMIELLDEIGSIRSCRLVK
ncbi:hypothetical protein [Arthrobacter sp. L77]|uniref:hypothetical protein n=1 Tax=Arthrobacter sp. L77 TaxID=1496689 RepID=UPI00068AAFB7|nr:hypothetical protein [Arthrobacter sp. L77]